MLLAAGPASASAQLAAKEASGDVDQAEAIAQARTLIQQLSDRFQRVEEALSASNQKAAVPASTAEVTTTPSTLFDAVEQESDDSGSSLTTPSGGSHCLSSLHGEGVDFSSVEAGDAADVAIPVRVEQIHGIKLTPSYASEADRPHTIMDCRLALALATGLRTLDGLDVSSVIYSSAFRPNATTRKTGRPSGHAYGLAIDIVSFGSGSEGTLDIEGAWGDRSGDRVVCQEEEHLPLLQTIACRLIESSAFHVFLTPHYDAAHRDHLHLEVRPETAPAFVR